MPIIIQVSIQSTKPMHVYLTLNTTNETTKKKHDQIFPKNLNCVKNKTKKTTEIEYQFNITIYRKSFYPNKILMYLAWGDSHSRVFMIQTQVENITSMVSNL